MRVWPYQMLDVLYWRHIVSQWRECLALSAVLKDGPLNHATVNRINDYPIEHFAAYVDLVIEENKRREYVIGDVPFQKLKDDIGYDSLNYKVEKLDDGTVLVDGKELFEGFHDERYLKQCLYKYQEFIDIDMINQDDWDKVISKFGNLIEK